MIFHDDLITEKFRRDVFAAIERGEITQEDAANAKTVDSSICCGRPLTNNLRCSLCQEEHKAKGAEYVIDQDNRIHLVLEVK